MNEQLLEDIKLAEKLLKKHGYAGDEILIEPNSGEEDTASNWAAEAKDWNDTYKSIEDQFASLVVKE